jgi:hypothetical protein
MTARLTPTIQLHQIAVHEAAHSATSIAQRVPFIKVTILPNEQLGFLGLIEHDAKLWYALKNDNTDPRIISKVERMIVTSLAGGMAHRKFAPRSNWRGPARSDRASVDRWLQHLIGGALVPNDPFERAEGIEPFPDDSSWAPSTYYAVSRATLKARHAKYRARAKALVDQIWSDIEIVARALLEHKTLSQAQVRRLMNRARRHPRSSGGVK